MNTELKNHHKATIHQAILECCADVLDNDDVVYHQLHLGVSDPVNREESELHIRMADAAYSEYEKTMFQDDTIQSCGLLPSQLLKQRDELIEALILMDKVMSDGHIIDTEDDVYLAWENELKEAQEKTRKALSFLESTNP